VPPLTVTVLNAVATAWPSRRIAPPDPAPPPPPPYPFAPQPPAKHVLVPPLPPLAVTVPDTLSVPAAEICSAPPPPPPEVWQAQLPLLPPGHPP
jgi:hypothetical protein